MKRCFFIIISLFNFYIAGINMTANAQDDAIATKKHSVVTNSFWANWYVQGNLSATSFWGSQENSAVKLGSLFKGYRTNLGISLALGKWFTPGMGLRTKLNGFWGRSIISEDKELNANKYWTLQEQALFNLSNMLKGYNEERLWDFIPYVGAGIGRNMSYKTYAMGFSVGLLNTFRLTPKVALNLDINYGLYDADLDGISQAHEAGRSLKNRDRLVNFEVGVTYRLGKPGWSGATDAAAMQSLTQSEIDALNAIIADMQAEIDRLSNQQEGQPAEEPAAEPVGEPIELHLEPIEPADEPVEPVSEVTEP